MVSQTTLQELSQSFAQDHSQRGQVDTEIPGVDKVVLWTHLTVSEIPDITLELDVRLDTQSLPEQLATQFTPTEFLSLLLWTSLSSQSRAKIAEYLYSQSEFQEISGVPRASIAPNKITWPKIPKK